VRDVIAGARDGLAMQDRYEALSRLSDRELAKHGLTRDDFPRLAVNGEQAFFATILNIRAHTENSILWSYKGRGWDDSTERELNNDLANYHCSRF
jgi:hypothetical protein